jgi:hypothetical protein
MTGCRLILLLAHPRTGDTRQTATDILLSKDTVRMLEDSQIPDRVTHLKSRLPMAVLHQ